MKSRKIYKISLIFLFLIIVITSSTIKAYSSENYIITTKQDFIDYLLKDEADMEGSYILTSDLDFTTGVVNYQGVNYQLDISPLTVSPIGEAMNSEGKILSSYYNSFKGSFNGSGYVIKGLNIRSLSEDNEYVGLFGYNQGIISNLGLVDSTVDGGIHVGGIAGYNMGIIVGCYNTSSITGIGTVGGITGINYGYIRNSYNTGYVAGATKIGGIVGHNGSVISAVYDLGIISGEITEDGRKEYGYIFGYNNAQGVIGYVEDNGGSFSFYNPSQKYSVAGAYYSTEYDIGVGYNLGYVDGEVEKSDNVMVVGRTIEELKDINTYDQGFRSARSNIYPIGSDLKHQTTGFYIRENSGYRFPVVGTSYNTTREHVENFANKDVFEGSGTTYMPFLIKNENDLKNIDKNLHAAYKLVNNIKLENQFSPIGDGDNYFKGILNGNGKRISNLVINSSEEKEYVGLFAFNSGIIHNISVDVNITVANSAKVGGLAGFNNGQIYESYVMGSITGQTTVGGLVGANELGSIKNSYNMAIVKGNMDIGGIAGFNSGTVNFVYSAINPEFLDVATGKNLGAISGYNENTFNKENIINAVYYGSDQVGYQTSVVGPYNNPDTKVNSINDLTNISSYTGFKINEILSGGFSTSIWTIESGVNNNMAYLTKTPLFRVEFIELDTDKELIENGAIVKLFDDEYNIILGIESDTYGNEIDLSTLIQVYPTSAENKKVKFEIISGKELVTFDGSILKGKTPGDVVIKAISEDGAKEITLKVIVRERVNELFFVDDNGDVFDSIIEVENKSQFYLYAMSNLNVLNDANINWQIVDNGFLINKGNGLFEINYINIENKIINGDYQKSVMVTITITCNDNSKLGNSITIIVKPSSTTYNDDSIRIYENNQLLELVYNGGKLRIKENKLVKFDTDFIRIEFINEFYQTLSLSSEKTTIENIDEFNNKLFLSKGDIVDGRYINRTNEIELVFTAENGNNQIIILEITKALSENVEIDEISFNDGTKDYTYDRVDDKFIISGSIPFSTKYLYLGADLLDNRSSYSKSITHKISYYLSGQEESFDGTVERSETSGSGIVNMKVVAEDGTIKIYQIIYNTELALVDTLDNLFIGEFGKESKIMFSSETNDYHISLKVNDPTELFLKYTTFKDSLGNDKSKVFVSIDLGSLMEGNSISFNINNNPLTIIQVLVQSEFNYQNGIEEYNVYVISIRRELSSEASILELFVNNDEVIIDENMEYLITNNFDYINIANIAINFSKYSTLIVTYISFEDYLTELVYNYNAVISPNGNKYNLNLNKAGEYLLRLEITSEDENTVTSYYLNIIKEPSVNSSFSKIIIDGVEYDPLDTDLFDYDILSYTYTLKEDIIISYDESSVNFIAFIFKYAYYMFTGKDESFLSEEEVNLDLSVGLNSFDVVVYAEDEFYTTNYKFNIRREYNSNTPYKVEHYKQSFDGTYSLEETEDFYDVAYKEVSASSLEYLGFTHDTTIKGTISDGVVSEDGSLVLKLYYKRNNYELSLDYDSLKGNVLGDSGIIKYDYALTLQAVPSLGYEFIGWFVDGSKVSDNSSYDFKMPANDLVIEARFNICEYSITYVLDGGINNVNNKRTYIIDDLNIILYDAIKQGYIFYGWYLNADFSGETVVDITEAIIGDLTLHARWLDESKVSYKVNHYQENFDGTYKLFDIENLSGEADSLVNATIKNYLGFTYIADLSTSSGIIQKEDSLVLELYYKRNTYYLEINNLSPSFGELTGISGNVLYNSEINLSASPNFGYEFIGWYIDGELISDSLEYTYLVAATNLVISGEFKIIEFIINYVVNNGVNDTNNPLTYTIEDLPFTLFDPSKLGYTFLGWYLNFDFSGEAIVDITADMIGDITLYSKWEIKEYSIILMINGIFETEISLEYNDTLETPPFELRGYLLSPWYLDPEFNDEWDMNTLINDNYILYASFELVEYEISYHNNGGILEDGLSNINSYNVLSSEIVIYPLTKLGYTFIGWFDSEGNEVTSILSDSVGDIELSAIFEINSFNIIFNIAGRGNVTIPGYKIIDFKAVVEYGNSIEIIIKETDGFELSSFIVNGVSHDSIYSFIIDNIDQDYSIDIKFIGAEPGILTLKEASGYGNKLYSIDRSNEINLFLDYYLGQTVANIRETFVNSPDRIKFYNGSGIELDDNRSLGTGYIIKLYNFDYTEIIDEVYMVLPGDANGDGLVNTNDVNIILRHIKLIFIISSIPYLHAANPLNAPVINTTVINSVLRHIKLIDTFFK